MGSSNHKVKRYLFTKMCSIRNTDGGLVVQRSYTYDKLGRPLTRQTLCSGGTMNETFDYNDRSEGAHVTRTVGASKKKCSDLYDACILGCRGGKWPRKLQALDFPESLIVC